MADIDPKERRETLARNKANTEAIIKRRMRYYEGSMSEHRLRNKSAVPHLKRDEADEE